VCASWIAIPVNGRGGAPISGTIRCGGPAGCGSLGNGAPIDVDGSVRAHRTDASGPDVNASFTAADQGHYQLVNVPPGVYNLYASAVGCQTGLVASNVAVGSGDSLHFDLYLQPCAGAGCTPVPEFGSETVSALITVIALIATVLLMNRKKHR
jgi:hypothetical protein